MQSTVSVEQAIRDAGLTGHVAGRAIVSAARRDRSVIPPEYRWILGTVGIFTDDVHIAAQQLVAIVRPSAGRE